MNSFYTIKLGETHAYTTQGKRLLVTRLSSEPMTVTQVKSKDKDGYDAVQVAIGKKSRLNKPLAGHLKKANVTPAYLKEVRVEDTAGKEVSEAIAANQVFTLGDLVKIRGKAKGKGFAGGMKRWGFGGGPRTHGQSDRQRSPGSIGQGTDPGRVWKGKKMAGRMGGTTASVLGSQVVFIDETNNELWVTGTVPGAKGELVEIIKIGNKEFQGLMGKEPKVETEKSEETAEK